MMRSLFSGVSGLRSHQTRMDVIGNNIANVNTTGYKAKTLNFSDMLYQTTQAATGPNANNGTGGTNPRQIGLGVKTAAISTSITQEGSSQSTGNPFDIKISGEAFFIVSDGTNTYYTRDGAFDVDEAGNLVMSSTGYIVQGWGVDDEGNIIKGTVGDINVMAKNSFDPAATTAAKIKGILDKNDSDLETEYGSQINVPVYDALGYEYSLKFGILPVKTVTNGTRDITNTENEYSLSDPLYKVDTSTLKFTYKDGTETRTLSDSASPELMDKLKETVWKYVSKNTTSLTAYVSGDHTLGAADKTVTVNLQEFIANSEFKDKTLTNSALRGITELTVEFSGESGFTKTNPSYPLSDDVVVSKISQDAVDIFYTGGTATNNAYQSYSVNATGTGSITALQQSYVDDNDESKTDYVFKNSVGGPIGNIAASLNNDVMRLLQLGTANKVQNVYTTQEAKELENVEAGSYTISLLGMTDSTGKYVDISALENNGTTSWDLMYSKDKGTFRYVGSDGNDSFTLNLTTLGTNFSNVEIDLSDTSNVDNGKKTTLEGLKSDGRKVGTMTGVSIGTDGIITANYSNGMSSTLGQICVGTFANAMGLENAGDNLYQVTANSGDVSVVDIKASGTGTLTTGVLEMSNVDLSQQFTDMITTQRGFQANSRIITVSDTLLEELVNIKR